jgi:large subunit ribosomal protein L25
METLIIEAEPRDDFGKGPNRRLRSQGRIPAVVYGGEEETLSVSVDPKDITDILRSHGGGNTIFELSIKGREGTTSTMIKDYQIEPIKHELLHADLVRIAMDNVLSLSVNVEIIGTPVGVKTEGGMLDFVTRTIDISCLPKDIPETIEADVSNLAIGDHLRVSDLTFPESVTLETEPGVVVAHVIAPKKVEEEEEAAEEAAAAEAAALEEGAEPEVIKKGKAEDEGSES